jgi:hypothetical protein
MAVPTNSAASFFGSNMFDVSPVPGEVQRATKLGSAMRWGQGLS